jgi:hypothetical protein
MSEPVLMSSLLYIVWIDLRFCIIQIVLLANFIVHGYLPGMAEDGMWRSQHVASSTCGVPDMWRS